MGSIRELTYIHIEAGWVHLALIASLRGTEEEAWTETSHETGVDGVEAVPEGVGP